MFTDHSERSLPTTPIPRSQTKSTPRALTVKPPPVKSRQKNQTEDDISIQPISQVNDRSVETSEDPCLIPASHPQTQYQSPKSYIEQLPPEILESIVGYVVGHLGSTVSEPSGSSIRNWNAVMRHPRRKKVADLAMVSRPWRRLIQERVYRHIKVQGTKTALEECGDWFLKNSHLQAYVRHLEVLVPIWELKSGKLQSRNVFEHRQDVDGGVLHAFQGLTLNTQWTEDAQETSTAFRLASKNATMDEIFGCAQGVFPCLFALTIEGGHCKRPPKIQYFRQGRSLDMSHKFSEIKMLCSASGGSERTALNIKLPAMSPTGSQPMKRHGYRNHPFFPLPPPPDTPTRLPTLPQTRILILKGAWNIIRSSSDFSVLSAALPSLNEFHCTYHKPKTDGYIAICDSLTYSFASTITHLNLCLEGLYTKSASSIKKWRKLYPTHHICRSIGSAMTQLESLSYTGRICGALFSSAMKAADHTWDSCTRLKSIDIVVINVCRDPQSHNDGTGIHNWPFIQAFEALILQALRCLQIYTAVSNVRIRYIDLDSPVPLLNPMFHIDGDRAWGFWSDEILALLAQARPAVQFLGAKPSLLYEGEDARPLQNVRSTSMDYYKALAHGARYV